MLIQSVLLISKAGHAAAWSRTSLPCVFGHTGCTLRTGCTQAAQAAHRLHHTDKRQPCPAGCTQAAPCHTAPRFLVIFPASEHQHPLCTDSCLAVVLACSCCGATPQPVINPCHPFAVLTSHWQHCKASLTPASLIKFRLLLHVTCSQKAAWQSFPVLCCAFAILLLVQASCGNKAARQDPTRRSSPREGATS